LLLSTPYLQVFLINTRGLQFDIERPWVKKIQVKLLNSGFR
jgi:hypothetical protein